METKESAVNIVPNAAGQGVREALEIEANRRGLKLRPFIGRIYAFAVDHRDKFKGTLDNPRVKDGKHIGAVTDPSVAKKLSSWAKDNKTSRGLLCNYILEMAIEKKMFNEIFV